jgi:hypothetical protein
MSDFKEGFLKRYFPLVCPRGDLTFLKLYCSLESFRKNGQKIFIHKRLDVVNSCPLTFG